ncbi:unnamed protein product [Closterium sp. Naga37s-1]|nr:unnamed protein product [Closterium sp. Naga37s-1]
MEPPAPVLPMGSRFGSLPRRAVDTQPQEVTTQLEQQPAEEAEGTRAAASPPRAHGATDCGGNSEVREAWTNADATASVAHHVVRDAADVSTGASSAVRVAAAEDGELPERAQEESGTQALGSRDDAHAARGKTAGLRARPALPRHGATLAPGHPRPLLGWLRQAPSPQALGHPSTSAPRLAVEAHEEASTGGERQRAMPLQPDDERAERGGTRRGLVTTLSGEAPIARSGTWRERYGRPEQPPAPANGNVDAPYTPEEGSHFIPSRSQSPEDDTSEGEEGNPPSNTHRVRGGGEACGQEEPNNPGAGLVGSAQVAPNEKSPADLARDDNIWHLASGWDIAPLQRSDQSSLSGGYHPRF